MRNGFPARTMIWRVVLSCALATGLRCETRANAQLPSVIDLGATPGTEPTVVHRIYGGNALDKLGPSDDGGTCFGDVNGDGLADYIVGAGGVDTPGGTNAGELYVVYGRRSTWNPTLDLGMGGAPIQNLTRIRGEAANDLVGFSSACGDVNGDGLDDLVIGAPTNVGAPDGRNGRVYVIYGNANLVGAVIDLTKNCGISPSPTRIDGEAPNDHFGYAVACADVNGDGYADILVGAIGQIDLMNSPGKAYVIYGGPALPGQTIDLTQPLGTFGEIRITGDRVGGRLGRSIAGGDFNGDGFDDVAIGTSIQNEINPPWGAAFILYGGSNLAGIS